MNLLTCQNRRRRVLRWLRQPKKQPPLEKRQRPLVQPEKDAQPPQQKRPHLEKERLRLEKAAATTTKTHTRTPHKRAASTTRTQKTTTAMKRKTAPKSKPMDFFGSDEKEELLLLIGEIIHLHKLDPDGLKSLEAIERILDKYNQRYTKPTEKFDAIVKYGMSKDLKHADKHIYMFKNNLQPDTAHLYELLNAIGNHKVKFPEAREKMLDVYKEAPHRHKKFK